MTEVRPYPDLRDPTTPEECAAAKAYRLDRHALMDRLDDDQLLGFEAAQMVDDWTAAKAMLRGFGWTDELLAELGALRERMAAFKAQGVYPLRCSFREAVEECGLSEEQKAYWLGICDEEGV